MAEKGAIAPIKEDGPYRTVHAEFDATRDLESGLHSGPLSIIKSGVVLNGAGILLSLWGGRTSDRNTRFTWLSPR